MAGAGSILGNAVLRLEDPTLLTGEGKYVDDLVETGMLHVALVRSHGRPRHVNSVDIGDAASMPGVVAVFHAGNDLGMPAMQGFPMLPPDYNRPIFASERVRFVGDVIAAVVAESQAQANDAAEQVVADIEPLAGRPDAPPTGWRPTPRCCSPRPARTSASPPSSARTAATRARAPTRSPRSRWSASVWPACRWRTTASSPCRRTAGSRCGCRTRRRTRSTAPTPRCSASTRLSCESSARGSVAGSARRPPATSST